MKIIISRKGFDSGYGGVPSPVFPGGGILSLPIPSRFGVPVGNCMFRDENVGDIVRALTRRRHGPDTLVHLDPDLERGSVARTGEWVPAFGQVGAAQSHLRNQGVGAGDLFLFFGWFQPVKRVQGQWAYVPGSSSFHALFGWLQVQDAFDIAMTDPSKLPTGISHHPHVLHAQHMSGGANTVYTGRETLDLPGSRGIRGAGSLSKWTAATTLTASGCNRSTWSVPQWMAPRAGAAPLSYHGDPARWSSDGSQVLLRTVAKGQEFVLDTTDIPEARTWALRIIKEHQ